MCKVDHRDPSEAPPTTTTGLVLSCYSFSDRTLHTNDPYVTSFLLSLRVLMSLLLMNLMVLIGFCMRPPTQFVAEEIAHFFLHFGLYISCL